MVADNRNRNLTISINATTAGLERGISQAEVQLNRLRKAHADAWAAINEADRWLQREIDQTLAEVEAREQAAQEAWERAGVAFAGVGVALAAGLGLATRAAIQWESAWAGVTKTVDGSAEEMAQLEEELRSLALQIPLASTELAGIAATAGQLGVARQDIAAFTETVAAMAVSTNLTAEEAATAMARFANIMGTPQAEVGRLGSAIVDLGNNSAATEAEIMEMALRIAGAGQTAGLAESDVLGLAAALSSMGLSAELGGSAISRVIMMISNAVRAGGDDLAAFAQVAGVTAAEFASAFSADPADAIAMFVSGLAEIQAAGGDVYAALRRVGVADIEVRDTLLRAAGASDVLTDSLARGAQAWEENTALLEEAAARYATTESQLQLAQNALTEFGITMGETFLPLVADAAERVTTWATAWQTLDDSTQDAVASVGGVTAAITLLTGAIITMGPRLFEFRDNMALLAETGATPLRRGLGRVASFLTGPWGLAIGGALALGGLWLDQKAEQIAAEQEWIDVLRESQGAVNDNVRLHAVQKLHEEGLLETAKELGIATSTLVNAILEEGEAREALNTIYDNGRVVLHGQQQQMRNYADVVAQVEEAVKTLLGPEIELSDLTAEQIEDLIDLSRATLDQADTYETASEAAQLYLGAIAETTDYYRAAEEAASAYREEVERLSSTFWDAIDAEVAWEQALDDASAAVAENGATLDITTQAGRDNIRALKDMVTAGNDVIATMIEQGASLDEVSEAHENMRQKIYDTALEMGASEEEAEEYASTLREVPKDVATDIIVTAQGRWNTAYGAYPPTQRPPGQQYAEGGAVVGPGGPRDDVIPALLSNGEHVIPADEVAMAGGQDAIYRLRAMIRSGYVRFADGGAVHVPVQRFARGGAVRPRPAQIIDDHDEDTRIQLQRMTEALINRIGDAMARQWQRFAGTALAVVAAWQSQIGVPYSWGGGGPNGPSRGFGRGANTIGFDCSSLMQYGWARVGVMLPRTTYDQIKVGTAVQRGQEIPGDLVFPHLGHVAGVTRPGWVIHAPYTGATVQERPMYGHVIAIRRPKQFDTGGVWGSGELGINLSGRPERVLSPTQTVAFEQLVGALTTSGGVGDVHYHIHHVPGFSTVQDLQRAEQIRQRRIRAGRPG